MKRKSENNGGAYKRQKEGDKLKELEKKVNRIAKTIESKVVDVESNGWFDIPYDDNTAAVQSLAPVSQGTGDSGRVGAHVQPTILELNMSFLEDGTAGVPSLCRYTVIQCRGRYVPNIVLATTAQAFYTSASDEISPLSTLEWNNRRHYTVLKDECIAMNQQGQDDRTIVVRNLRLNVRRPIIYDDGSADYENGGIYVVFTSSRATAGNPPSVAFTSRLYYKDA